MSLVLTIPADALMQPPVAQALASLVLALGGVSSAAPITAAPIPTRAPTQRAMPAVIPAALPPVQPRKTKAKDKKKSKKPAQQMDMATFEAGLPERSRRFLEIVRDRKVVKVGEMLGFLGLESAKAVGGITGAIGRWAPVRGLVVPFEAITLDGERAWKWVGEEAAAPALLGMSGVRSGASAVARRFLTALEEKGSLNMAEAVKAAGVNKAPALTAAINQLRVLGEQHGVPVFEDTIDMRGSRVFRFVAPPVAPAETEADAKKRGEYATDGVRRRRKG